MAHLLHVWQQTPPRRMDGTVSKTALHVMFLEDNEADRDHVLQSLRAAVGQSFFVEHTETLAALRVKLAARKPGLILMDLCVPDSVGLTTFLRVREMAPDVPIIVQSGLEEDGIASMALHNGAQDYLVKGQYDADHLLRAIRYALERSRSTAALLASELSLHLASIGSNDGIWDWDMDGDQVVVSTRWLQMMRLAAGERVGSGGLWQSRVHPEDRALLQERLDAHLLQQTEVFTCEHRMLRGDGSYGWVRSRGVAVRDATGQAFRMGGSLTDLTAERSRAADISYLAMHDALTGLANRSLCLERIEHAIARARRPRALPCAVLFVDVDRFKVVNDSLGHMVGDGLLLALAARLHSAVQGRGSVARLGGDEFCVLLEDIAQQSEAAHLADAIQQQISEPFLVGSHTVYSTVSIGVTILERSHKSPADMLRDADMAMYRAKQQGTRRLQFSDSGLHVAALERLYLETELHDALRHDEFFLVYQPIVSLRMGQLSGVEALVRWQSPTRGLVSPLDFVPLAEETGLILKLGRWILDRAIGTLAEWDAQYGPHFAALTMSINVSPRQLADPELIPQISSALRRHGVAPHRIRLELTESAAMENLAESREILAAISALGVGIYLDDFGTGFSSLAYLQRLPIDTVKIDRSFVADIETDAANWSMVQAIVSMAHALGKSVVAEGIETAAQWELLKDIGCRHGQGYFFSKPQPTLAAIRDALAGLAARELAHQLPLTRSSLPAWLTESNDLTLKHPARPTHVDVAVQSQV